MPIELPAYYSSLAPFRAAFAVSVPILTYHKLGPRPPKVRLKGMYLSRDLFARQLQELAAAGFVSGSLEGWDRTETRRVVITFDDGYRNVSRYGLPILAELNFKAIQFLPVNCLGKFNQWDVATGEQPEPIMDISEVREWLAAGHEIGSHSLSHPFLTKITPEQAKEEIRASRKKLEDLFGRSIRHFCYPYGDWNPAVRDLVEEAGYATACTTDRGSNARGDSPYSLKRYTARYASRSLRSIWRRAWAAWRNPSPGKP